MQTKQSWGRVKLTEVNPHLVCVLCHGYFIDATTMAECPHSFCRSCILLYLETKSYCPICEVQIHKTKPHLNLKPDKTLQDIVYKLVPGLYHSEMKRRREFYQTKYPNRDLDLGPEARGVGVERIIYSPEDLISLSLEYYDEKDEFDSTDQIAKSEDITITYEREKEEWARTRPESFAASSSVSPAPAPANADSAADPTSQTVDSEDGLKQRFLQCPAVLNMRLLKKFIRIKYGLSPACTVEILYRRESLPDSYSLMDVAYIYTWKRNNPMRFYYRIHVPTTLRKILPPLKASSEPIKDTTPNKKLLKSPELLDAVGLRPKIWFDDTEDSDCASPLPKIPKLELDSKPKSEVKEIQKYNEKLTTIEDKEKLQMSAEETAKSLLLLRNGHSRNESEQSDNEGKLQSEAEPAAASRPPTGNGGVFKVPPSMTKRFFINGGKLVPVNPKTGKGNKSGDKNKVNRELPSDVDRFSNPLGLPGGPFEIKGGKLPPGSPRPPPNSEKLMRTKYMSPSGYLLNKVTPDVTFSQNKAEPEATSKKLPNLVPNLPKLTPKPTQPVLKSDGVNKTTKLTNGQPVHRKEPNRLEQIVQNCLKKETAPKSVGEVKSGKEAEVQNDNSCVKRSGTLNAGSGESDARAAQSIRPTDHPSRVDTKEESGRSILKRKLNDLPFNRRPMPPLSVPNKDNLGDVKNRRLVTPDVSIELMANPARVNQSKEKKKEPTDLTTLTNRFLHDIERMNKKPESEIRINKPNQMCASIVNIEKVPAPSSQQVSSPKSSPNGTDKSKISDDSDFSSEDQLFIDIRKKCEAMKRKNTEQVSVAIERVSKDEMVKSNSKTPPLKGSDVVSDVDLEAPAKPSGTHKKLPRLIEINAPPRPKLPALLSDPKQKTGLKMTTVRKEVPIGKEGPQVKRDTNGALDLSSGLSPPNPKSDKTPNRPGNGEKTPTPPPLTPFLSMTSFPMPEANRSPPIRIPSVKPKISPNPRPSSLSSSSPSPPAPADSRATVDSFTSAAYQQLMRQQMEFQSRIFASVNNNWSSRDPLTAKKMDDWMRNVMNLPHHPLMFPAQKSPEARK